MNSKTFNQLIKLNNDFYNQIAKKFDETRQSPWRGWKEILDIKEVKKIMSNNPRILDIASGNGRFYGFLKKNYKYKFEYIGLENNDYLLNTSREKYGKQLFKKFDVIKDLDEINETYDLIVAFGITHHIPSSEFREKWIKQLFGLLEMNGILVLSFWEFDTKKTISPNDAKYKKAFKNIDISQLENGDFFYGWENTKTVRYCNNSFYEEGKYILAEDVAFMIKFDYCMQESKKATNKYLGVTKTKYTTKLSR